MTVVSQSSLSEPERVGEGQLVMLLSLIFPLVGCLHGGPGARAGVLFLIVSLV